MSYPETLQAKNNPSSGNDRQVSADATPQEELYQHELMYFVYNQVLEASEQKPRELGKTAYIDSVSLIRAANKKALESIGRGVLQ
ncbi:MAG: hypothetical protein L0H53_00480 [Candidatus Nitrosocosmicus sp.]|nr:hypothetical protein [Candidatus Nitrosocosmicus sp.]MDN5866012.1 hypothetical protein [Candidatus Nitrosocosmicus sp.]